jgi:hypothetical protein
VKKIINFRYSLEVKIPVEIHKKSATFDFSRTCKAGGPTFSVEFHKQKKAFQLSSIYFIHFHIVHIIFSIKELCFVEFHTKQLVSTKRYCIHSQLFTRALWVVPDFFLFSLSLSLVLVLEFHMKNYGFPPINSKFIGFVEFHNKTTDHPETLLMLPRVFKRVL